MIFLTKSEPPLNEEDVPPGEWLCPRCKALHDIREMIEKRKKSSLGTKNFIKQNQPNEKRKYTISESQGTKLSITSSKTITNHPNTDTDEYSHKIRLLNSLSARKNPFADLVRISLLLNPREYELPEEYVPSIQFPGTSKKPTCTSSATREARHSSYSVKRAQELDRNNLPLILRTCFFCRKGCRKAPLINCDYCPLVYHADCIDPPLTTLPNTRWMCPNHVEPIAEEKLLSSSSFCERVKLWNHFAKPIDHESIKVSFLDKVHESKNPDPSSGEFIKLGCRVPKRIKRSYEKYIVSLEKYIGESDSEERSHYSQRETNEVASTKSTDGIQYSPDFDFSAISVYLQQMIDCSKILESSDYNPSSSTNAPATQTSLVKDKPPRIAE